METSVSRAAAIYESGKRPSRTLSKSDFKLARSCRAKLFFRENGYPDSRESNPYLSLLAQGGYMVEALAKAKYQNAIQLDYGGNLADDLARTTQLLARDEVTLFEATLVAGRRHARADILDKKGNVVRLIEVKSSLFDGARHAEELREGKLGVFCSRRRPFGVLADWREYIEDVTYQTLILERMLPGVTIRPFLVLLDETKRAVVDDIPKLFELVRRTGRDGVTRLHTASYTGTREQYVDLDLVTEIDVTAEVGLLRDEVERAATELEALLDDSLPSFTAGLERGSKCVKCEFRHDDPGAPNGFADCWGALAEPRPHMLELFSVGTVKTQNRESLVDTMFKAGTTSLFDIPQDALVKANGEIGENAKRQRRQIEYTRANTVYGAPELTKKLQAMSGRLHFIDFETSRLALPYHAGMRPYGLVTFQWSSHTVPAPGDTPMHAEWLNNVDVWPNQSFAESLRAAIGDEGSVLTWSHFEATTLKQIVADLKTFGRNVPELVDWMTDVFGRRIVDLHEWARRDYYHPGMKGRTSIKVVLDAIWQTDATMHQQFETWTGLRADASRDPYAALPPVEINGTMEDVHEGTGAMMAYQEMMYGADKNDPFVREQWASLLRQYCRLDTLSMVLIFEHWRRLFE
ncbi:MAG TPA: DUF2779 domain-containing protein [Gemmatimonadaceae bacterium]|nr:DUF2779 domain-containing protein [Gemmatimonadaceae bacterium]